jgi:hypothetical protein
MANAGIIGSGNILVIMKIEMSCPSERIIAMYINPLK